MEYEGEKFATSKMFKRENKRKSNFFEYTDAVCAPGNPLEKDISMSVKVLKSFVSENCLREKQKSL
jgi:hypothetical protein